MTENTQFKAQGLAFGRNLQRAFRIALMYSPAHSAAEIPLQHTYASLSSVLQQKRQFVFGFLTQQVVLDNILATDNLMGPLQAEFLKRGISGICFSAGLTFPEFKRGLGLLTTKPEAIEQNGGIGAFLKRNPVAGMRIIPIQKQARTNLLDAGVPSCLSLNSWGI